MDKRSKPVAGLHDHVEIVIDLNPKIDEAGLIAKHCGDQDAMDSEVAVSIAETCKHWDYAGKTLMRAVEISFHQHEKDGKGNNLIDKDGDMTHEGLAILGGAQLLLGVSNKLAGTIDKMLEHSKKNKEKGKGEKKEKDGGGVRNPSPLGALMNQRGIPPM